MITQTSQVDDGDRERGAGAARNDRPPGPHRRAGTSGRMRTEQAIRHALRRLLYSLDLTPPLDVELLLTRLGDARGRKITVQTLSVPTAGAFGALICMKRHDLILLQEGISSWHRSAIVLHEIGHIVLDHFQPSEPQSAMCSLADATHPPSYFDSPIEWEAETAARILLSWSSSPEAPTTTTPRSDLATRANSVERALGWREW